MSICSICHEDLNSQHCYTLLECNHTFHTNCICTWFRASQNRCPLCNDEGVNAQNYINVLVSEENYKELKKISRKKDAEKRLKSKVEKVVKLEKDLKRLKEMFKVYLDVQHPGKTAKEVVKTYNGYKKKIRDLTWKIKRNKRIIGRSFSQPVKIIIPVKQNV